MNLICVTCQDRPVRSDVEALMRHYNIVHPDMPYLKRVDVVNDAVTEAGKVTIARDVPTKPNFHAAPDRSDLTAKLDENSRQLASVGADIVDLRSILGEAERHLANIEAATTTPTYVRRAVLNEVWDKLLEAGHHEAGNVVAAMLKADREANR